MTTLKQWVAGARPKTLPAALAPVLVGTAFAGSDGKVIESALALTISLGLQIGVNFANDYSDGIRGTDNARIGPMRLVGSGAASAASVKNAALLSISIAAIAGVALAARSSWLLLLIGAISIVAAWTYTGGPKPYGYFALGELSVFIFFGLVATIGTYYAQVGSIDSKVVSAAIAIGCLACSILIVNNLRDRIGDEASRKRTLAVLLGERKTRLFYQLTILTPFLISLMLSVSSLFFLIALGAFPFAYSVLRDVRGAQGRELIGILVRTGRLQMIFALLLSIAAILAAR